jgi:predicted lipoprotein with Yx(FWY)xxD motif
MNRGSPIPRMRSRDDGSAGSESTVTVSSGADSGGTSTTTSEATPSSSSGEVEVSLASTSLGEVLVDGQGMTLYMFDPDKQSVSTCYDQCAEAWPPLTVTGGPKAGEGVDQSLLGVVERTDGTEQVTYGKWPLYYWVKDAAPGDVTGQAVNNVWWVVDAAGQPVRG